MLLKIYRKDFTNTVNFIIISSWPILLKPVHRSSSGSKEMGLLGKKFPEKGENLSLLHVLGTKAQGANSKAISLQLPHALSWSPGVAQHPYVSSVRLWNNNIRIRLLYPYLSRKSPLQRIALGRESVSIVHADEITAN